MKNLREHIKQYSQNSKIICEVYGTLGNFGIAVIWLTNQYTDVLKLVDNIKKNINFIFSSYTIFSQNTTYNESEIKNIHGTALVQLAIKRNINSSLEYIKNKKDLKSLIYYHNAGKLDLSFSINSSDLYKWFCKKSFDNDQKRNILYCNTRLSRNIHLQQIPFPKNDRSKNIDPHQSSFPKNDRSKNIDLKQIIEINDLYMELRHKFIKIFPKTAGMADTLDLLNCDYITQMSSAPNSMWRDDFVYQYKIILTSLIKLYENANLYEEYNQDEERDNIYDENHSSIYNYSDKNENIMINTTKFLFNSFK